MWRRPFLREGPAVVPGRFPLTQRVAAAVVGAPTLLGFHQVTDALGQVVAADGGGVGRVEVQLGEDHFGQGVLDVAIPALIEALRVTQQVERQQEELSALVQRAGGVGQLPADLGPFVRDGRQLLLELGLWPARLAHQIEVVVLLGVQFAQAGREALLEGLDAAQFGQHGVVKLSTYRRAEVVGQANGGVVPFYGRLDVLDLEVGQIAGVPLPSSAHEVEVGAAVALTGIDDESFATAAAPQQALEPVVVGAGTGTAATVQGEYALDALEQFRRHQRLVPALVFLALVADVTGVVVVAQDLIERVQADGLGGCLAGATTCQPSGDHLPVELRAGVLTGAEQFERLGDERSAFRVNGDGPDFAAFGLGLPDVEVAEFGRADAAAVLDFLAHLVANVRAAGLRLVLVHGMDDRLDHRAFGRLAHVQNGGHHATAVLGQLSLGDGGVDAIPKDAIEVVDDDVVDVFVGLEPGHHLLKDRPLVDGGGGPARLDELLDHIGIERIRFSRAGFPLGWNRDSLGVVVGVDLAGRGYAQIQHGPLAAGRRCLRQAGVEGGLLHGRRSSITRLVPG